MKTHLCNTKVVICNVDVDIIFWSTEHWSIWPKKATPFFLLIMIFFLRAISDTFLLCRILFYNKINCQTFPQTCASYRSSLNESVANKVPCYWKIITWKKLLYAHHYPTYFTVTSDWYKKPKVGYLHHFPICL